MGGPVRTQIVWVSAGSKLSGRDRGPVQHAERQERETVVGFGRGPVRGVRSDRPRPPSLHARLISRTGPDPRLAEGGRVREGQGVRPDRGGNSPGWGDQPVSPERRPPRAGRSRWRTLSQNRSAGWDNDAGRPGAGEIRRRFRGVLSIPAAGGTDQALIIHWVGRFR